MDHEWSGGAGCWNCCFLTIEIHSNGCVLWFSAVSSHLSLLGVYSAVCVISFVFEGQHQNQKRGSRAKGAHRQAALAHGQCFGVVTCWDRSTSRGAASLKEGMRQKYKRARFEEMSCMHLHHPLAQCRVHMVVLPGVCRPASQRPPMVEPLRPVSEFLHPHLEKTFPEI